MGRTARLTKSVIDAAQVEAARYIVWDAKLKGFGLRVEPTGVKTYIVRYRANGGGRRAPIRQLKIGRVAARPAIRWDLSILTDAELDQLVKIVSIPRPKWSPEMEASVREIMALLRKSARDQPAHLGNFSPKSKPT